MGEYKNALDDALVAKEFMGNDAPALFKEAQTLITAIEKECAAQSLACK